MARLKDILGDAMTSAIGIVIGGIILFLFYQGSRTAPSIENWLSPVVDIQPLGTARDEAKACFVLRMTKRAKATPITYDFFAQTKVWQAAAWGTKIPLSAYLADDANNRMKSADLPPHAPGVTWTRHYCFELPGTVADWQELLITGEALHRRHPFWTSVTPVPPFIIPPMKM